MQSLKVPFPVIGPGHRVKGCLFGKVGENILPHFGKVGEDMVQRHLLGAAVCPAE